MSAADGLRRILAAETERRDASVCRVLALDLAKTETGYSVVQVENTPSRLKFVDWGRLRSDKRCDRYLFQVASELAGAVGELVREHRQAAPLTVVFEHPIFGKGQQRTDQQFVISQRVLENLRVAEVNAIGIAPTLLKSFIKAHVPCADARVAENNRIEDARRASGGLKPVKRRTRRGLRNASVGPPLEKRHIREFYETHTYPLHPDWPEPNRVRNDDELDAVYLSILGATYFAGIPDLATGVLRRYVETHVDTAENWQATWDMLVEALPFLSANYPKLAPRAFDGWSWVPEWRLAKDAPGYHTSLKAAHSGDVRGRQSGMFNQIAVVEIMWDRLRSINPAAARKFARSSELFGPGSKLDATTGLVRASSSGLLYPHVPVRRDSSRAPVEQEE